MTTPQQAPAIASSGLVFTPRGIFNFTAAAGQATDQTYKITAPLLNFGLSLFCQNAAIGDTIDLYLKDVDGVTYPPGTRVAHLARGLCVFPNVVMEKNNAAMMSPLPVGLYLEMVYTSVGQNPVGVLMNMRAYEQVADFQQDSG